MVSIISNIQHLLHTISFFLGSAVCHQMAERSFSDMSVCARCSGIGAGIVIGTLFLLYFDRTKGNQPFSKIITMVIAISFLPITIDGVGSYIHLWESNNIRRILTGVLAGYSLPALVTLTVNFQPMQKNEIPIYRTIWEVLGILCICLLYAFFAILHVLPIWLTDIVYIMSVCLFYSGFFYIIFRLCWKTSTFLHALCCGVIVAVVVAMFMSQYRI